jgi:hypothetical protein
MRIKDLAMSRDLTREELSAVRGGSNFGFIGGQRANQVVCGGHCIGSPVMAVDAAVNPPRA